LIEIAKGSFLLAYKIKVTKVTLIFLF